MLGEMELLSKQVDIKQGETADISFEIPSLTGDEKKRIDSLEDIIRANLDDPASAEKVDQALGEYESMAKDD
jgi:hypothetical protein